MGRRAAAHGDQQTQAQTQQQTLAQAQQPVEQPPASSPEPMAQRTPFAANFVGATLVVSAPEGASQSASGLARTLPVDRGRTVVVVDFPGGDQSTFWPHVVTALGGRGPIRLAVSHAGTMRPTAPAQWLAEQLQAEVVAPDGVLTTVPGAAFVVGTQGYGSWVRFQPNASPMPFGRRFPVPQWEAMDPNSPWQTGEIGISEPIPAGLWLRAQQPPFDPSAPDARPIVALPCRDNVLTVVVGGPGQSSIPTDEVCRLLTALPQAARSRVRLVPYGIDTALGRLVADELNEPIAMFTGLPVGNLRTGGPAVIAVDPRGQQTWRPFVTEVRCIPHENVPTVSGYRAPVQGLGEVTPGVFVLGDGVVLEVVPSGLWVRESDEPYNAADVRSQPVDPEWARLTVGTPGRTTPGAVAVHGAALVERLEPEVRKLLRVVFCDATVSAPQPPALPQHAAPAHAHVNAPVNVPGSGRSSGPSSGPGSGPGGHSSPAQIAAALGAAAQALSGRDSADNGTGFFAAVTPAESEGAARSAYAGMPPVEAEARPAFGGDPETTMRTPVGTVAESGASARSGFGGAYSSAGSDAQARSTFGGAAAEASRPGFGGGSSGEPDAATRSGFGGPGAYSSTGSDAQARPGSGGGSSAESEASARPGFGGGSSEASARSAFGSASQSAFGGVPAESEGSARSGVGGGSAESSGRPSFGGAAGSDTSARPAFGAATSSGSSETEARPLFEAVVPAEPEAQARPAHGTSAETGATGSRPAFGTPQPESGPAIAHVTAHALAEPDAAYPSSDPDSSGIRFRVDGPLPAQPLASWEVPAQNTGERETVSAEHCSTDVERDSVRRALGERYGVHAATVCRLLAQRPDAEEDPAAFEAMVTDLTALLACVSQDEEMVIETLRMGRLGRLRPYVACIVSGMNRLPVHNGIATVWGQSGPTGPRRLRTGDVLTEHGLLDAIANPAQRVEGAVEYVLWSVTGRRVEVADRVAVATEERVLFAPGTPFRVLAVVEAEGDHPMQVMLQEMAGPAADQEIQQQRPSVLSQLERAAANLRVLPSHEPVQA